MIGSGGVCVLFGKEDGKAGRQKEMERGRLSCCIHQYFSEVMSLK
mgnify:CR=1 FL=1